LCLEKYHVLLPGLSELSAIAVKLRQILLSEACNHYFSVKKGEFLFSGGGSQPLFSVGYRKFVTVLFFGLSISASGRTPAV
jgi:hypothetical protein